MKKTLQDAIKAYFANHKILVCLVIFCYVGLLAIGIANAGEIKSSKINSKQTKLEQAKTLNSKMSLQSLQELESSKPSVYIIQEMQGGGIIFKACSVGEVVKLAHTYCKNDSSVCEKIVLISAEQGDDELQHCFNKQEAYKNYIKLQKAGGIQ